MTTRAKLIKSYNDLYDTTSLLYSTKPAVFNPIVEPPPSFGPEPIEVSGIGDSGFEPAPSAPLQPAPLNPEIPGGGLEPAPLLPELSDWPVLYTPNEPILSDWPEPYNPGYEDFMIDEPGFTVIVTEDGEIICGDGYPILSDWPEPYDPNPGEVISNEVPVFTIGINEEGEIICADPVQKAIDNFVISTTDKYEPVKEYQPIRVPPTYGAADILVDDTNHNADTVL